MANLLDRASIVLTPTAYSNGEALCIKPKDGSGDFQFSRNSAATRVNSQGLVETTYIDLPRINYEGFSYDGSGNVVPNSGCGSWLFEPQSTNLIPYSEDFSDASWVNTNSTDTSNYGISPDGLNNSTRFLTTSNTGSFLYINSLPILDATNYTLSFWVKSNGNSLDKFRLYTTTGGTSLEFTSTNKWIRYEYNFLSTGTTTNIGLRGVIGQETDIQIWGAQLEQLTYATSYIPTSGSTVTRIQDVCNNASIPSLSGSHTVYADYKNYSAILTATNRDWQDGSNRVYLIYNYGGGLDVYNGSAFIVDRSTLIPATNFKIAIVTTPTTVKVFINGVDRTINNASPNLLPITKWSNTTGSQGLNSLVFFNEALTDQELTELTTL